MFARIWCASSASIWSTSSGSPSLWRKRLRGQRTVWCAESASPALYRNPADALKEHVTNAIDEHLKSKLDGTVHEGRLGRSVR